MVSSADAGWGRLKLGLTPWPVCDKVPLSGSTNADRKKCNVRLKGTLAPVQIVLSPWLES